MKFILKLFWIFLLSGGFLITSCEEKKNNPVTYTPVTLYPVKESKTYIYEGGKIVDSMIFRLTFDNQDRLVSQLSVKEDLLLELDYSQIGKVVISQKKHSTNV